MKVFKKDKLVAFIREHPETEQAIRAWIDVANAATFEEEILKIFRHVKFYKRTLTFQISAKPYFISVGLKYSALFVERVFKESSLKSEKLVSPVTQKRREIWI